MFGCLFLAFLAATSEALVANTGKASTHERSHDEEPHLAHGAPSTTAVGEQGDAKRTGGVHRSVGQRDADEVDEHQGETDGQTAELAVGVATVGDAEDDHQEHEGQQAFNQESTASGDGLIARVGTAASLLEGLTKTIGSEDAGSATADGIPNHKQQSTSDDTADELGSPVAEHFLEAHAAIDENAKTDGGIEVGTRNVADAISHGDHGKAESDGYTKEADMSEQGRSTATEHQDECAEQFGEELFTVFHNV